MTSLTTLREQKCICGPRAVSCALPCDPVKAWQQNLLKNSGVNAPKLRYSYFQRCLSCRNFKLAKGLLNWFCCRIYRDASERLSIRLTIWTFNRWVIKPNLLRGVLHIMKPDPQLPMNATVPFYYTLLFPWHFSVSCYAIKSSSG